MIKFPDAPDTDPFKDDKADNDTEYRLRSDYQYRTLAGILIKIPKGFETDGVSAPQATWAIVGLPPDGFYRAAGVTHDYLYSLKGKLPGLRPAYTRAECDAILLEIMKRLKVPFVKRCLAYLAVRLFGGSHWKS